MSAEQKNLKTRLANAACIASIALAGASFGYSYTPSYNSEYITKSMELDRSIHISHNSKNPFPAEFDEIASRRKNYNFSRVFYPLAFGLAGLLAGLAASEVLQFRDFIKSLPSSSDFRAAESRYS